MKILTERDATKQFINCVPTKCFNMYKQCKGQAIHVKKLKRLFAEWDDRKLPASGKIDFILEPTRLLEKHGWELGCIGVEIKSSFDVQNKLLKAIAQILDYQSCIYSLPNGNTELSMIFLYPYRETGGEIASIMMQEGLGFVRCDSNDMHFFQLLHAGTSHEPVFSYKANGEIHIRKPRFGKRYGHR